ncbi:glomulin [Tetranychus urticae]|uniref:Uncharacterized protein n=1 Tax=Tetranychus urticae TaxID=32264 RepID=T1K3A6_TETUR|nr:glomulin [Tetranychus urticae]
MTQIGSSKSPLEYLTDVVEYRCDHKKPDYENVELIRKNISLVKQQLINSNLSVIEREKLIVILLGLLYHPFLKLDLRPIKQHVDLSDEESILEGEDDDFESNVNLLTVHSIIQMIAGLNKNLYTLIDSIPSLMKTRERMFLEMDLSYKTMLYSISVISYVGYGLEKTIPDNCHFYPNVFSGQYILIRHLPILHLLLSRKDDYANEKGLVLSSKLFKRINPGSLDVAVLDLLGASPIDSALMKIMKYSCDRNARSNAFEAFKLLINCFKLPARCQFLLKILANPAQEQGAQRLVLTIYKDLFVYEKDWKPLIGNTMLQIIRKSFELSLPNGVNTDLAENYDSICTILNFIRYLLLRDKYDRNETKIWNIIDSLRKDSIDLIWQAVQISRDIYKARLHELEQPESRSKEDRNCNDVFKVEIFNDDETEVTPQLTEEQEKESLTCGLINFELLESLIRRIDDIIAEAR